MTSTARIKVTHRLPADLANRVADHAKSRRVSQTAVVEAALASFFSPDGSERLEGAISRRLDRQGRQYENLNEKIDLVTEAVALFVRFWLTNNPPLPDSALAAAKASGNERYGRFVESLARRIARGHRLGSEVSHDVAARDVP